MGAADRSQVAFEKGTTVSKNGVTIPFMPILDDNGRLAGYRYPCQPLETLQPGDVFYLFIPDLSISRLADGAYRDAAGVEVLGPVETPTLKGAWRQVTLDSNGTSCSSYGSGSLNLRDELRLRDSEIKKRATLRLWDGWYQHTTIGQIVWGIFKYVLLGSLLPIVVFIGVSAACASRFRLAVVTFPPLVFLPASTKSWGEPVSFRARLLWFPILSLNFLLLFLAMASLHAAYGIDPAKVPWRLVIGATLAGVGATAVFSALMLGISRGFGLSGYRKDSHYEWWVLDRSGRPAAKYKDATRSDVYDHNHGRGSWEKRSVSFENFSILLLLALFVVSIVLPIRYLYFHSVPMPVLASVLIIIAIGGILVIVRALTPS